MTQMRLAILGIVTLCIEGKRGFDLRRNVSTVYCDLDDPNGIVAQTEVPLHVT